MPLRKLRWRLSTKWTYNWSHQMSLIFICIISSFWKYFLEEHFCWKYIILFHLLFIHYAEIQWMENKSSVEKACHLQVVDVKMKYTYRVFKKCPDMSALLDPLYMEHMKIKHVWVKRVNVCFSDLQMSIEFHILCWQNCILEHSVWSFVCINHFKMCSKCRSFSLIPPVLISNKDLVTFSQG